MRSKVVKRACIAVVATVWLGAVGAVNSASAAAAGHAEAAVWSHGELYGVILTDTVFKSPPPHSTDIIFNFMNSGLSGQRSVSDAAPGDPNYNGGRWNVMLVSFTDLGKSIHDPDGDGKVNFELKNAGDVLHHAELGHLMITEPGVYFECPLLPRRAHNQ